MTKTSASGNAPRRVLFHAARTLSLQPPAQVKRVVIQAYGYYARLGGRTAQVVALVKKLFDEAGAAIEVVEGPPLPLA